MKNRALTGKIKELQVELERKETLFVTFSFIIFSLSSHLKGFGETGLESAS